MTQSGPEEGNLKPQGFSKLGLQPAGDVPPLLAIVGMRSVVGREIEDFPRRDQRKGDARGEKVPAPHQSSLTARTGSMPMASLPAHQAVRTANDTNTND